MTGRQREEQATGRRESHMLRAEGAAGELKRHLGANEIQNQC